MFAEWAAITIAKRAPTSTCKAGERSSSGRVAGLEATREIAQAIARQTGLEHVLELIAKRARALTDARAMVVMLADRGELVVAAPAGEPDGALVAADSDRRAASAGRSSLREAGAIATRRGGCASLRPELGVADAHTALLAPMLHRRGRRDRRARSVRPGERSGRAVQAEADEQLMQYVRRLGRERGRDRAQRRGGSPARSLPWPPPTPGASLGARAA